MCVEGGRTASARGQFLASHYPAPQSKLSPCGPLPLSCWGSPAGSELPGLFTAACRGGALTSLLQFQAQSPPHPRQVAQILEWGSPP